MDGAARWQVDVLGPLRVRDAAGRDVTPHGARQRRLLALLVLRRGLVVSVDAGVDALWPTDPPRDPKAALQNQLSRLRALLPGTIESVAGGYRLDPQSVELDLDRLVAWVADGPPLDSAVIDELLGRWSGPAYPELDGVDDARVETARLDELRLAARERRAEHRLAMDDLAGLVTELTASAAEEPLRERPVALLIEALVATGRRADALRTYDDFRRRLGAELGTAPSVSLNERHAALLRDDMPAPSAVQAVTRLPRPASSLVGRDALAEQLDALADASRLVTLVGPGGVGKTRLLLEIGRRQQQRRPARPIVLCELASADPSNAADAVAAALRIDARAGVSTIDRVTDVLADSEVVVLLDNCEHVLPAVAALVETLLARCLHVQVVATSRERLRVTGEHVRVVPPLSTDGPAPPAVALFLDRAGNVAPDFRPDAGQLAVVADLVRRLDGLPLAIELAAARLHTDEIDDVVAGLDRRFTLLSGGSRTSARHGSLAAAVAWSFEQLDVELATTFAGLSVFAGPFTADDAAAVCGLSRDVAADALAQLVERSLVMRSPDRHHVLLETLRAFGAEQLLASGRHEEVARRHADHLVAWIARARVRVGMTGSTLDEIDASLVELRNALAFLLDRGDVHSAGRLVGQLFVFGFLRLRPDVLAWAEAVCAADPDDLAPTAATAWTVAAYAAWMAGDVDEASRRTGRALRIDERGGGPPSALVLSGLGATALFDGRLDEAAGRYRHARAVAATTDPLLALLDMGTETLTRAYAGDPAAGALADALLVEAGDEPTAVAAYAWYCAGELDLTTGNLGRAGDRFARALAMAEASSATFVTGAAGASKASIDARVGDPLTAAADYRRLIGHWRRAGMWSTQWTMLRSIAGLLERLERPIDAAVLAGAVLSTGAGHRVYGSDAQTLAELAERLRAVVGAHAYEAAFQRGAQLDGDAAVEHALRALPA